MYITVLVADSITGLWKNNVEANSYSCYICEKQNVCFDVPPPCPAHQLCETSHSGDFRCVDDVSDGSVEEGEQQQDPCEDNPCVHGTLEQ